MKFTHHPFIHHQLYGLCLLACSGFKFIQDKLVLPSVGQKTWNFSNCRAII